MLCENLTWTIIASYTWTPQNGPSFAAWRHRHHNYSPGNATSLPQFHQNILQCVEAVFPSNEMKPHSRKAVGDSAHHCWLAAWTRSSKHQSSGSSAHPSTASLNTPRNILFNACEASQMIFSWTKGIFWSQQLFSPLQRVKPSALSVSYALHACGFSDLTSGIQSIGCLREIEIFWHLFHDPSVHVISAD